jgi:hypothetical protein
MDRVLCDAKIEPPTFGREMPQKSTVLTLFACATLGRAGDPDCRILLDVAKLIDLAIFGTAGAYRAVSHFLALRRRAGLALSDAPANASKDPRQL